MLTSRNSAKGYLLFRKGSPRVLPVFKRLAWLLIGPLPSGTAIIHIGRGIVMVNKRSFNAHV